MLANSSYISHIRNTSVKIVIGEIQIFQIIHFKDFLR